MLKISNVSHVPQRFRLRDGSRVEIAPGEHETVDIDPANGWLAAAIRAKLVHVTETRPVRKSYVRRVKDDEQRASPEPEAPAVTLSDLSEE